MPTDSRQDELKAELRRRDLQNELDRRSTSGQDGGGRSALTPGFASRGPIAFLENAASVGSGLTSLIPAGLAGLGAMVPGGRSPEEAVKGVTEAMTYRPRTTAGQELEGNIGQTLGKVDELLTDASAAVPDLPALPGRLMAEALAPGSEIAKPSEAFPSIPTAIKTAALTAPMLRGATRSSLAPRTPKQNAAVAAQENGYVINPGATKPRSGANRLEGAAGRPKIKEEAAYRNQQNTNRLVTEDLGLGEGTQLSVDVLESFRKQQAAAYKALEGQGRVKTDATFKKDINAAVKDLENLAADFPELASSKANVKIMDFAGKQGAKSGFDIDSGLAALRELRQKADKAFRGGKNSQGAGWRNISDSIEAAIERDLSLRGQSQLVENFRAARQDIAKSYSVQKALVGDNVSAQKLGAQLNSGQPLTGNIRAAAEFGNQFKSIARVVEQAPSSTSVLDSLLQIGAFGTGAAIGGPTGLAAAMPGFFAAARPYMRAGVLGPRGQGMAVTPQTIPAQIPGLIPGAALAGSLLGANPEPEQDESSSQ